MMKLFSFLKGQKHNTKKTIEYKIEDWLPIKKHYKYDRITSLNHLLLMESVPKDEIVEIMSSRDPFDSFNLKIMNLDGSDMRLVFEKQVGDFKSRVMLWAIRECDIYGTSENVCMYILYRIGQIFQWNMFEGRAMNLQGQSNLLNHCTKNNYKEILQLFDRNVLSAFAFVHSSSKLELTTALRYGLDFIANNSKNINSGHGNLYNLFGQSNVEAIVYKIFEASYTLNNFNYENVFYRVTSNTKANIQDCDQTILPFETKGLRYCGEQIVNKKTETYYYLSATQLSQCQEYLETLKKVYSSCKAAYPKIKVPEYKKDELNFFQGHDGTIKSCLFFIHQFTGTGKISKHPSSMSLRFKNNLNFSNNRLYFDKSGKINRVETYYDQYSAIATFKDEEITITNIYMTDKLGKKNKVFPE